VEFKSPSMLSSSLSSDPFGASLIWFFLSWPESFPFF
jgi:hypothetical protein